MKHRLSITVDEETLLDIFEKLKECRNEGRFRNKSHLVEYAVKEFLRTGNNLQDKQYTAGDQ